MEKRTLAGRGKIWIETKLTEIAQRKNAPIECCTWQRMVNKYDDICLIVLGGGGRCVMKQFRRCEVEACVDDQNSQSAMEARLDSLVEFFCRMGL